MRLVSLSLNTGVLRRNNGAVDRDVQWRAQRVALRAKSIAPVDTGRLRGNIVERRDSQPSVWLVVANTPYAIFVEQGTRYMGPRNYLKTALREAGGRR